METTLDFENSETPVKVIFKVSKIMKVKAATREEAHKLAYNTFMDTSELDLLRDSQIEDFFVETTIDGPEGSDMLHG